jgi:hypothetical protein
MNEQNEQTEEDSKRLFEELSKFQWKEKDLKIITESPQTRYAREKGSHKTATLSPIGGIIAEGKPEGTLTELVNEAKKAFWREAKREQRIERKEIPVSQLSMRDSEGYELEYNEKIDRLMWQSGLFNSHSIDPYGHKSLLEEMEMEALTFIELNKESINERIGAHTDAILRELILFYEFNISYKDIGQKIGISERTIQRRVMSIQEDAILPIECPLVYQIIAMKAEKANNLHRNERN